MTRYAAHAGTLVTPQGFPIPGSSQVANSAGGFAWEVGCWTRLDRFLVLGNEGGSYYASERAMTLANSAAVAECAQRDLQRTVRRIVEISRDGRAPKNDPAIFALAQLSRHEVALTAMPEVCRTGTHLFQFVQCARAFRGWGRGLKRAVRSWYESKDIDQLAYQLVKYRRRKGWSHRDVLRLSKPKASGDVAALYGYACGKVTENWNQPRILEGTAKAHLASSSKEVAGIVREYRLVHECVPKEHLQSPEVWEALLEYMPLTALVRNLVKLSSVGVLKPLSNSVSAVCDKVSDVEAVRKARLHPIAILIAQRVYAQGPGDKGRLKWEPVSQVVDALDAAFYTAFKAVEPTGKRWLLALDVSASMGMMHIAGTSLTPRDASAAMALVTANVESRHHLVCFSSGTHQSMYLSYKTGIRSLPLSPRQRLRDAVSAISNIPFGGTDCALPMLWAMENKVESDVFVVYTDSETWHGHIHPSQALRQYRQKTGINAKLVVCGMVANNFTIADPNDFGMLDVVGFDTSVPDVMRQFAVS